MLQCRFLYFFERGAIESVLACDAACAVRRADSAITENLKSRLPFGAPDARKRSITCSRSKNREVRFRRAITDGDEHIRRFVTRDRRDGKFERPSFRQLSRGQTIDASVHAPKSNFVFYSKCTHIILINIRIEITFPTASRKIGDHVDRIRSGLKRFAQHALTLKQRECGARFFFEIGSFQRIAQLDIFFLILILLFRSACRKCRAERRS